MLEFDDPIYAFGATFQGLNNGLRGHHHHVAGADGHRSDRTGSLKTLRNRSKSFFGFVSDVGITSITFTGRDVFGMDGY